MDLSKLKKIKGNKKPSKRVGRGTASGVGGHTTGKGHKGQKSRAGNNLPYGFEGGQVPLYKKLPQIGGFNNPTRRMVTTVSLSTLNMFKDGDTVTPQKLVEHDILTVVPKHGVKVLANGSIKKKLTLEGFDYSSSAKTKLETAGCTLK